MTPKRRSSPLEVAFPFVVLAAVAITLILLLRGYRDCSQRGGTYVRGLFSMECINAQR